MNETNTYSDDDRERKHKTRKPVTASRLMISSIVITEVSAVDESDFCAPMYRSSVHSLCVARLSIIRVGRREILTRNERRTALAFSLKKKSTENEEPPKPSLSALRDEAYNIFSFT